MKARRVTASIRVRFPHTRRLKRIEFRIKRGSALEVIQRGKFGACGFCNFASVIKKLRVLRTEAKSLLDSGLCFV